MTSTRRLAFAVACVALGIFGLSLQGVNSILGMWGMIVALVGFVMALIAAVTADD